jgi:hypothetical protein
VPGAEPLRYRAVRPDAGDFLAAPAPSPKLEVNLAEHSPTIAAQLHAELSPASRQHEPRRLASTDPDTGNDLGIQLGELGTEARAPYGEEVHGLTQAAMIVRMRDSERKPARALSASLKLPTALGVLNSSVPSASGIGTDEQSCRS